MVFSYFQQYEKYIKIVATIPLTANTNFDTLKQALLLKYPSLQVIAENIILSLNEEYIDDNQQLTLREGDEVAVIPPISGG